jgi:aryl-alcohol dehydrogenase-like predicted oxidoreductase
MDTCRLGPNGPTVPRVGFGGMPLSLTDRPDEPTAIAVLHAALDAGVLLFDTANVYCLDDGELGHNERLLAKALASWKGDRTRAIIATKGGMTRPQGRWERDGRPVSLRRACEQSLRSLGTEHIELYQLHTPDSRVPLADSVGELARLRDEGKIRQVGLSNVSVAEVQAAAEIVPIATVQNRLSPFFREAIEDGVVAHCGKHGIGFLAYSPVGGGRLNKKLPAHPIASAIASAHGATAHEVVLAWALAQGPSVIVIPGARAVATALSSIRAGSLRLTAQELSAIDRAEFSRA